MQLLFFSLLTIIFIHSFNAFYSSFCLKKNKRYHHRLDSQKLLRVSICIFLEPKFGACFFVFSKVFLFCCIKACMFLLLCVQSTIFEAITPLFLFLLYVFFFLLLRFFFATFFLRFNTFSHFLLFF
jgi:hypothetical protein